MMGEIHELLEQLRGGGRGGGTPLTEQQAEWVFERVLTGGLDEAQIGALLSLIAVRGPTVEELVGGARVMRRHVRRVVADLGAAGPAVIDTCGTGGAPKTFNISTAGAIVAAACAPGRVAVAKHGSTSRTGRGSAEVLEKLGVNVAASPEVQARCLREVGVCFSFSIHHHPAMKHAAGARRALGFPTIFNLLGPLTNPAGARRQLIGTYSTEMAEKLAATAARLGTELTVVVTSRDGMDELTTTAVNELRIVEGGGVRVRELDARSCGMEMGTFEALLVADLDEAARAVEETVRGVEGPRLDVVLLNAAAALLVGGVVEGMEAGLAMAREGVAAGDAARTLERLRRMSNEA